MKRSIKISLGIVLVVAAAYITVLTVEWRNLRAAELYERHFTPIPDLNTFVQTAPKIFLGAKKVPHAVLLLHGWSASPQEFQGLAAQLKQQGIPYYAPQLTGFGLGDLHLLRNIRASDWLRDAIYAYDLLAAYAQEISIVGHSNGGLLAIYVAGHRPVKHLILSSPYLAVSKQDKLYKTAVNIPIIRQLFEICLPVFAKTKRVYDKNAAQIEIETFRYPTLPIQSVIALWQLQDKVDIDKANFQDLTVLYGRYDKDVDIPEVLAKLNAEKIPYEEIEYKQSAHNLLQSVERKQVVENIVDLLD